MSGKAQLEQCSIPAWYKRFEASVKIIINPHLYGRYVSSYVINYMHVSVTESSPLRAVSSRDSVGSHAGSVISYGLNTRDPSSGREAKPPPTLRKVPSPLHVRADVTRAGE